ncbi:MAG TPA: glycosyltransferase family 39 protein [Acidobacteriaceae bacterium]|nr:glycosyltransferase family 39 protein [Acidobacteriaceae bacterium]
MPETKKTSDPRLGQILFRRHRDEPAPAWMIFSVIYGFVFLSHLPLLRLPYFWDEAGYYIPAAWDFFRTGSLIPYSTLTNAHPPLPAIYLAFWWKISGFVPAVTRLSVCLVATLALTAVFVLVRRLLNTSVAAATTLLTTLYPVWFTQSTLAQADIFACAATMWALVYALEESPTVRQGWVAALWFSVAALSKETAIVTPLALVGWHLWEMRRKPAQGAAHRRIAVQLALPVLPLAGWYLYHFHKTGYMFGNPQFVRYNAVLTLHILRFMLALAQRLMQITIYMNLFVPVLCMVAAMFLPALVQNDGAARPRVSWNAQAQIGIILLANVLFFSVMGGALLARYLLPLYPLILLLCVSTWRRRVLQWPWIVALSVVAFLAGLFVNPPYRFAPEDNLTYRSMIVMQQQGIYQVLHRASGGTVLTAWPATDELTRPELGYVRHPVSVVAIDDFSLPQIESAMRLPGYDAALVFSTKYQSENTPAWLRFGDAEWNREYFGYHRDVPPGAIARLLHGDMVWRARSRGLWTAVILFNRPQVGRADLFSQPPRASARLTLVGSAP